jgi:HPt (histidine-containing phosphotransfer) domain-containing protein
MSAKLQSLIVAYCRSLPLDVQALAETLSPAAAGHEAIIDNLAAALQRVHRIKGAGGSLGFAAVSLAAARLEADLRALDPAATAEGGIEIGGAVLESLAQLEELAAGVKPEGSSLYGIDLSQIAPAPRRFASGS